MNHACCRRIAAATLLAGAAWAQAQPAAPARTDPLDARAVVPPLIHRSAVADHRRYADQVVGSWKDANDTVGRVGGWRAYAREASGSPGASAPTSSAPATPAPAGQPAEPSRPGQAASAPAGHAGHHR